MEKKHSIYEIHVIEAGVPRWQTIVAGSLERAFELIEDRAASNGHLIRVLTVFLGDDEVWASFND